MNFFFNLKYKYYEKKNVFFEIFNKMYFMFYFFIVSQPFYDRNVEELASPYLSFYILPAGVLKTILDIQYNKFHMESWVEKR